jgi:tetratricopeptide (TPR) repeat protein
MTSLVHWVEVHRLAVAGREPVIARSVGRRVSTVWLRTSRFADVAALARATLTLGPDASALYDLGWALSSTGWPRQALACCEQALNLYPEVGDRGGEAVTLTNIGGVYEGWGDRQRALIYFQQALPIAREVGDRAGEATTRYNIAMIHRADRNLDRAIRELELVVDLDRQIEHPDLASDTAELEQVRRERAQTATRLNCLPHPRRVHRNLTAIHD